MPAIPHIGRPRQVFRKDTACPARRDDDASAQEQSRMDHCRPDEPGKQRMRPGRLRLELRMELHGHEPGMLGDLDDLDQPPVGAGAAEVHPVLGELLAVGVVELVAVAVPLGDLRRLP